jgi:hypothetical protein
MMGEGGDSQPERGKERERTKEVKEGKKTGYDRI